MSRISPYVPENKTPIILSLWRFAQPPLNSEYLEPLLQHMAQSATNGRDFVFPHVAMPDIWCDRVLYPPNTHHWGNAPIELRGSRGALPSVKELAN